MDIDLKQNLARIIRTLEGQGMKSTKIAHAIGYTTTRQLYNSMEGESLLSTKAVKGLISNLNVNPTYLFVGKGDMFLADEAEIETLRRENREWIQRHNEVVKTVMALYEMVKTLEKRNSDLIELSSAAIKYHQGQKKEEQSAEVGGLIVTEDENVFLKRLLNETKWKPFSSSDFKGNLPDVNQFLTNWMKEKDVSNKEESDSLAKRDKK